MLKKSTIRHLESHCAGRLDGKTVIVTGANSGIGFKATEELLYLGARVIMACRNAQKAAAAAEVLRSEYPQAQIRVMALDIADCASIKSFVKTIEEDGEDIHALVNNAGVYKIPGQKTADGWELIMGTNYLGTYILTNALLPYLKSLPHEVRITNTSSISHKISRVHYDDFFREKRYRDFFVYGQSKLCITGWTLALAKQLEGSNIKVFMTHPGISITAIASKAYGEKFIKSAGNLVKIFNSPEKSALAIPDILCSDYPAGTLLGPRGIIGGWGYPKKNRILRRSLDCAERIIPYTENVLKEKI